MTDWLESVSHARDRVSPEWTPSRERSARFRVERGLGRRRAYVKAFGGATLVVVALVLGLAGYQRFYAEPASAARDARPDGPELLRLTDGSLVTGVSREARVEPVEVTPHLVRLRLRTGSARFDVARREDRRFQVQAGDVTVTVLGTAFTVQLAGDSVRVRVERGRVDVAWAGVHRELGAGEELVAAAEARAPAPPAARNVETPVPSALEAPPPNEVAEGTVIELDELPAPAAAPTAPTLTGSVSSRVSWRTLAQDGDYRGAFERMTEHGPNAVRDEPGDLLFAADVARLSGHPDLAVKKLERVLRAHASDSRAPLAAFTLGRTLLDSLGRPREAAETFAKARMLAPGGALSQDALAREVESWSRAGESGLARARALEYVERYPNGRREKAVRSLGGLE